MSDKMKRNLPPYYERIARIAQDHMWYAKRYPERIKEIGDRLKITIESALAIAIADQICEEFSLTEQD